MFLLNHSFSFYIEYVNGVCGMEIDVGAAQPVLLLVKFAPELVSVSVPILVVKYWSVYLKMISCILIQFDVFLI